MALINNVHDEEERKRRLQEQARQTAESAAQKAAQQNAEAARRNSAGASKLPEQSAADVIKAAKEKAKTGTVTKTPKQYANSAQYVKKSNPVRQTFNYETLGTQERVDQVASWIVDPKEKQAFLNGWTAYTGTESYKNQQKRKEQLQELAGLYDANGAAININTASYAQVVQGIRSIADATKRKEAAAKLEEMTETRGSRFYGQTYDKDTTTSYLGSPDFDEAKYKKEVSRFENAFYAQNGYDEQNANAYFELLEGIQKQGYSDSVNRQLKEALDAQYKSVTGKDVPKPSAPTRAEVKKDLDTGKDTRTLGEKVNDLADRFVEGLSSVGEFWNELTDGDRQLLPEKELPEGVTEIGKVASASVVDMPVVDKPAQQPEAPKEVQGPVQQKPSPVEQQGDLEDWEALALYMQGGELSEANRAKIAWMLDDGDIMLDLMLTSKGMGVENIIQSGWDADNAAGNKALIKEAQGELARYSKIGKTLGKAADTLATGALPQDMTNIGYLMLGEVMRNVQAKVENGYLTIPAGENMYEYAISQDPELRQKVSQVNGLLKTVNDIKTENVRQAKADEEQAMQDAIVAVDNNTATDDQIAMVASQMQLQDIDVNKDALRGRYLFNLNKGMWYEEDGAFWAGDSAAAQEGNTLRALDGKTSSAYMDYKRELKETALSVLDEYTRVAISRGKDLETYLGETGVDLDDIMDIAYNRMLKDGSMALADPELPAAVSAAVSAEAPTISNLEAAGMGAAHGVVSYAESFMNTPYQVYDIATYEARREEIQDEMVRQYGALAPQTYRQQLIQYANSGKLDKESSEALLLNIRNARNIFDVAYDIDPGWLANTWRDTMESLGKTVDELEANTQYMGESGRKWFNNMSGLTGNLASMAVSTLTGGAAGKLGAGAKLASAIGTAAGFGVTEWDTSFEQYKADGMSDSMAAYMALRNAGITVAMNMGGTGSGIDLYFGKTAAQQGFESAIREKGFAGLIREYGKQMLAHGVEEAGEEMAEAGMSYLFGLTDGIAEDIDQGKQISLSGSWKHISDAFNSTDVKELAKEITTSGLAGFVYGELFSVIGVSTGALKGAKQVKLERTYGSIDLAGKIARGDILPDADTLAEFVQSLQTDLQDSKFCRMIDDMDRTVRETQNMAVAALSGIGSDIRNLAIEESRKADDYEKKADAAQDSVQKNQGEYLKARAQALKGDLNAAKLLDGFRIAWAEAGTALQETTEAAAKCRQKAAKLTSDWIQACRLFAGDIMSQEMKDAAAQVLAERNAQATQIAADSGMEIREGADPAQVVEDLKFMGEYPPTAQADEYVPEYTDEDAPPEMEGYSEPDVETVPTAEATENAAPTDAASVAETAETPVVDAETQALQEEPALDLKGNMRTLGVSNKPGQFAKAVESWDGQQLGLAFVVAKTGDTLKGIGMADADVVLKSDKLKLIKEKHPEMSDAVIAQLPEVIENPVVVMESATIKDRVVLMGMVTDDAGSPVAVVVSINPNTNLVAGTQFLRMNSAYGKDRSPQDWVNKHNILYADKNRAAEWAMSTGLQLPVDSTPNSGSSTSIVAQGGNDVKGNIQADYVGMDNVRVQPTQTDGRARHNPIQTFNRLAKDLGIGKTFGTRKMNGLEGRAAGYYETNAQYAVSDTRHASSIEVDAHELGHALAARLNMTGTQQMVNNLTARFPANYPAAQLPGEAFAEFFWRYMVSDQEAQNFAGQAYVNTLERNLRREGLLDSVKTAQREVRQFLNASAEERFRLMTRDKSDTANEDTIGERLMDAERQFISSMVDSTRAAEDVNAAVREQNNGQIDEAHNLRNSALMQGHATKRAATVLNDHLTDVHGTVVGDSLKRRLADAGLRGRDFDTFVSYMLAKHSIDRDRQNKLVVDRGAISIADTETFIRDTERDHPEIAAAARAFQEFRHDFMMEYMVRTGFMTERTLNMFEAMYPNYVPTYRVKDRGRRGIGGQTYTIRQATGSTEQIINPMDSFVDMVNTIVAMNLRNETYKTWDRVYNDYEGMGIFGREVTQDRRPDANFAATQDEVLDVLMQANADDDVIRQVLNIIGRPHNTNDVNLPNIIRVQMEDGSTKFYEIFDQPLFDMFEGTPDSGESVSKIVGHLTSFMTAMTTGSNPVFGIRNALRDYQNSVNYGSWAATYVDGLGKWLNAAWDVFRDGWIGEHTGLNTNNATYEQYKALGGGGWTRVETKTKKGTAAYRGELIKGYNASNKGRTAKWLGKKIWNGVTMSRLNEIIEQTSRYAEYKHGQHDLSTVEGRREAFLAAQDVTTDFSRRGNSAVAREMKALVPFFNASLQGIYRTGRQFTEGESGRARVRFMKTVINTGLTSALASLVMLKYMDDEDKEEFFYLSDDLKAKHMYLPNFAPDILGESPLIRIPLNQDPLAYAIHAAVTNAMWSGEGEEWAIELGAVADNIMNSLNPVSSTIFDPLIAVSTNKNWYGGNIVPRSMEGELAINQYTAETAEMFKWLSHAIYKASDRKVAISPMMLQYIAEQYTGFVGQMVIPFFSKNEFTGEINGIDAVIEDVRKTLVSDPLKSNDIVSTVYDNSTFLTTVTKAGSKKKALDMLRGGLSQREAEDAVAEAKALNKKGGAIYEAKQEIQACYDEIDGIEARTDLTDEQKYLLQSEVRRQMIEIALDANEVMAEFREKYIDGESFLTRFMRGTVIRKESDDD